ncbi:enolase C-terminal domain-like protein [Pedococcus sp. 5OH_020]|uniref:enolase C-terminal domain-like protein n=1 Tax=Pedococcus sp. 5OH_020 TaxID=2989814 RepID=UPI0022E9CD2D|nr:enolase C-terminal domain-like protein [Pedococcus sp. 5OH_020]
MREPPAPVDRVEVRAYTVPTDAPEADGTASWDSTSLVLVQLGAADAVGTGWSYAPAAAAGLVHELLEPVVEGADPFDVPGLSQAMIRAVRNAGRPGLASYAISAVDVALWDLKSRLLGLPLHQLLGSVRTSVPVYGSGGFTTYDQAQLNQQLEGWLEQGIPRVKIKIGEAWGTRPDRDLERMRHTRGVIGSDVELYVDANGGYSRKQAIRLMRAASALDIRWLEEPVSSDDHEGLREVRDAVDADVTAGEYGSDLYYFRRLCQTGAVDCVQVDVTRCGGITEWLRAAAVTASFGLDVSGHCAPHLHVHVAAATPNLRHLEWFHDHARIERMFFEGALDPCGGSLSPRDDSAGHGLTLRDGDVVRFRVS